MTHGDIYFYDKDFNLLTILKTAISVNWRVNFCKHGSLEIHLEKNEENVRLLCENEHLFIAQGDWQAYVTGIKIDTECVIFAKTTEWLLTKFLLADFSAEKEAHSIYKIEISASELACIAVKSALSGYYAVNTEALPEDTTNKIDFFCGEAKSVHDILYDILNPEKLGFSFKFNPDDKSFNFKVIPSRVNEDISICDEFKTSYDASFVKDIQNKASGGIYYQKISNCGSWDAKMNVPQIVKKPENFGNYYTVSVSGSHFGFYAYEGQIIMCRSKDGTFEVVDEAKPFPVVIPAENKGIFSWSVALSSETEAEAQEELLEYLSKESFTCKTKNLIYGKDFFLGDILKTGFVAESFVLNENKMITGIHVWEEAGEYGCLPVAEKIMETEEEI